MIEEFRITFLTEWEVDMKKGRPKKQAEVIEADPLQRAEQMLKEFENEAGAALVRAGKAVGDGEIDAALAEAGECHRRAYAFGHALFQGTGRSIYRRKFDFQERLNEFLRRRWIGIKHGATMATAPLPTEAVKILAQLQAMKPASKIFEGENEFRQMLAARGLVEIDDDDYKSQTRAPRFPSID